MGELRLTTPDGYFEQSLEKTLASAGKIKKRRTALTALCAAAVVVFGVFFMYRSTMSSMYEKEYYAMESEVAQLDVFLEIN